MPTQQMFLGGGAGDALAPWYDNLNPFNDNSQVSYWKLEQTNPINQNNSASTSTLDGTPSFTPLGSAAYWNNPNNSTINCDHTRNAYPISFSIWCYKPTGTWTSGVNNQLLMNWNINGQRLSICNVTWTGNGVWEWSIMYGGTNHWTFAPSSRPENEWMHVVYSVAGSNNSGHNVFQNGGSALSATNRGGGHGGSAGTSIGGNSGGAEDWNGYMYNVRIFNKALSQSEAAQLYANDKPPGA